MCDITNDVINLVDLNTGKKTEFVGKGGLRQRATGEGFRRVPRSALDHTNSGGVFYVGGMPTSARCSTRAKCRA